MVNSYYTYSCIFLSFYKTYLVLTYHTGNYHPRQRNRMQGSKSPSPKAKSMLFCILNTVVMNIYIFINQPPELCFLFSVFLFLPALFLLFFHVTFETTVKSQYWPPLGLPKHIIYTQSTSHFYH